MIGFPQPETDLSAPWRLFVALPLPERVREELETARSEPRRALSSVAVRWTRREQFHLTLRFLGNVDAGWVGGLTDALRYACSEFSPLKLRAERLGFFPNPRRPRVFWVGVQDEEDRLPRLQHAVEKAVSDFTSEPGEERFTGHVTLGRIKFISKAKAEALAAWALNSTNRCFGQWTADQIELIRSELTSSGSNYTTLATLPLAASGLAGQSDALE